MQIVDNSFELDTKLSQLTKEQLEEIVQWTLTDLQNWTNNGAVANITQHCAMLHEAVSYQINKAHSKLEKL
tara:strand:- start:44 stop:256 length:213 start_codon:yes stop_codon:yes gene_type:complete